MHDPGGNVDGLPNVFLEGLASGTAVVASRVGGIPDIGRDGETVALVTEGDVAALGATIADLLEDDGRRVALGRSARADAEARLDWDNVAQRFEELYESIMNAWSERPERRRRIDLVFPRFKLLSGAERAILGLAEGLARGGHAPRIVCHQFDDSCRPRLAPGVELVVGGARLDWTGNRYLNAVFDYSRTLRLGKLLDPEADFRVFFGPALLLAWRRMRHSRQAGRPFNLLLLGAAPRPVSGSRRGTASDRLAPASDGRRPRPPTAVWTGTWLTPLTP